MHSPEQQSNPDYTNSFSDGVEDWMRRLTDYNLQEEFLNGLDENYFSDVKRDTTEAKSEWAQILERAKQVSELTEAALYLTSLHKKYPSLGMITKQKRSQFENGHKRSSVGWKLQVKDEAGKTAELTVNFEPADAKMSAILDFGSEENGGYYLVRNGGDDRADTYVSHNGVTCEEHEVEYIQSYLDSSKKYKLRVLEIVGTPETST
jgi:hypothetical protein